MSAGLGQKPTSGQDSSRSWGRRLRCYLDLGVSSTSNEKVSPQGMYVTRLPNRASLVSLRHSVFLSCGGLPDGASGFPSLTTELDALAPG